MSLNVSLLERTFHQVEPRAQELAATFYENLFTDCPESRPLFASTDMVKQQQKLITSLVYVVANLRYPEYLIPTLKDLGAKHVQYGAKAEHYPIVGAALLKALATYLGSDWTPEVQAAWTEAYGEITRIMLEGAQEIEGPQVQATLPLKSPAPLPLIYLGAAALVLVVLWGGWIYGQNRQKDDSNSFKFELSPQFLNPLG